MPEKITFACAHCRQQLRVANRLAGTSARCPKCRQISSVPMGGETVSLASGAVANDSAVQETLPPGRQPASASPAVVAIPGYEILDELGRGGMGVIYKARQQQLRRLVALKMILSGEYAATDQVARFRAEAEAVARLQHPNIVQIFEVSEHQGRPFLTLEYVAGGNLAQYLRTHKLTPQQAAALLLPLSEAVHYAHQRGIIHRDLKPANMLVAGENVTVEDKAGAMASASSLTTSHLLPVTLKITDFGLAKQLEGMASVAPTGPRTQSGAIMGTPSYMVPEQVEGNREKIGPAVDVYALGAILYEMLTGRPPFQADSTLDVLMQVVSHDPVPPRQLQPDLPRDLETICLKCLDKNPARRYASAQALADDLRRFGAGEPIQARPYGRLERFVRWLKRRKELVYLTGGVLLTLLVVLVVLNWPGEKRTVSNTPSEKMPVAARQAKRSTTVPADLQMVPRDVPGFLSVQAGELFRRKDLQKFQDQLPPKWISELQDFKHVWRDIEANTSMRLKSVTRVTLILPERGFFFQEDFAKSPVTALVSLSTPYGRNELLKYLKSKGSFRVTPFQDKVIYEPTQPEQGVAVCPVTDKLVLLGSPHGVRSFLGRSNTASKQGPIHAALTMTADHHIVAAYRPAAEELKFLHSIYRPPVSSLPLPKPSPQSFSPELFSMALDFPAEAKTTGASGKINLEVNLHFADAVKAIDGNRMAQTVVNTMLKQAIASFDEYSPHLVMNYLTVPFYAARWNRHGQTVRLTADYQWPPPNMPALMDDLKWTIARVESANNLKQIAIAMHDFHEVHRSLPAHAIYDRQTKRPLLSWRVALLPYIEQGKLYKRFQLDEPWDSKHNKALLKFMPPIYAHPLDLKAAADGKTHYQIFVGDSGEKWTPVFVRDKLRRAGFGITLASKTLNDIVSTDGTANTISVAEAAKPVYWTEPEDMPYFKNRPLPKLGVLGRPPLIALFDGSVHHLSGVINDQMLRYAITFNDGQVLSPPWGRRRPIQIPERPRKDIKDKR